jgi:hypothetical protein
LQQESICQNVYSKSYQYEWQYAFANAAEVICKKAVIN